MRTERDFLPASCVNSNRVVIKQVLKERHSPASSGGGINIKLTQHRGAVPVRYERARTTCGAQRRQAARVVRQHYMNRSRSTKSSMRSGGLKKTVDEGSFRH